MQDNASSAFPPQPQVFTHSLDWRFLLPIADLENTFVVSEEDADLSQTLAHVGIPVSNRRSLADLKPEPGRTIHSLVLPFGLPVRWVGSRTDDQLELYRSMRRLIEPGGYFLMGFNNALYVRRRGGAYHPSTPRSVAAQLGHAGYRSIEILGAMPDLIIPEYLLHLEPQTVLFALRHRFRRKPIILKILHVLSRAPGWANMSSFLPSYFAIAVA